MDYFTRDGVILRTGLSNKRDWYLLCIRELLDNSIDFLTKLYKGSEGMMITTEIFKDNNFFHFKVRNPNPYPHRVFTNKRAIFDYEARAGTKQDLYVISRGMLGDAMKQIRAFGHILIQVDDYGDSFEDKQWERPLIIRHNREEWELRLHLDKARQSATVTPKCTRKDLNHPDTEIEFTLPIPTYELCNDLTRACIVEFCQKYPLFTTDISFRFEITDNSSASDTPGCMEANVSKSKEIPSSLLTDFNCESPKATIVIEYKALHPISTESWEKQNSVHAYTKEEFKRRFVNIDLDSIGYLEVYKILQTYREGSNLRKTAEHELTLAELSALPEDKRNNRLERFYNQLKEALPPPEKLVLPYTTNREERKNVLIARLSHLYDNLDPDKNKASYKSIHGKHMDDNNNTSYPYFFEILAVPFKDPRTADHNMVFIGSVNYSISPKENSNLFEGDYSKYIYDSDSYSTTKDIVGALEAYGFSSYAHETAKIPCIIIANLVTPKRKPHGQDKSSIDITPFEETFIQAIKRLAADIKTYRALGIHFSTPSERGDAEYIESGRGKLEGLLTNYLRKEHGL